MMAADTAAVAGMAVLAAGIEEAVIRAVLAWHNAGAGWHNAGARWHGGGGNWNGGNWHGGGGSWHHGGHGGGWGVGPAIGLGVGLGLLGGALATAPYYGGYDYAPYAGTPAPTVWYWCDTYQSYYPSVPECPVPWRQVVQ
jgi:hypothetical protein